MDKIILANLNLMFDDYIRQMICDIHHEWHIWAESDQKDPYENPMYLKPFHDALQDEYVKRGFERICDYEVY